MSSLICQIKGKEPAGTQILRIIKQSWDISDGHIAWWTFCEDINGSWKGTKLG